MSAGPREYADAATRLAFTGRGRDLVVALDGAVDAAALRRAIAIFMPGWPVREAGRDVPADITIAMRCAAHVVAAASWPGS